MGLRKPQVTVSVGEDTKERWENAVEEDSRYSTLSDLVRVSVEREIANDSNKQDSGVDGKEVAKLNERMEALENRIGGMSEDFQELKGIIQNQTPSNQNLKSEVFATLPEGDMSRPLTPQEVAEKIGGPVDTDTVSDVLEELATQTGQVESIIGAKEGEIKYQKKGDKL